VNAIRVLAHGDGAVEKAALFEVIGRLKRALGRPHLVRLSGHSTNPSPRA
jgi:hypothetical protein